MAGRHRLRKRTWRDVAFVGGVGAAASLAGMAISALVTPGTVPLPTFTDTPSGSYAVPSLTDLELPPVTDPPVPTPAPATTAATPTTTRQVTPRPTPTRTTAPPVAPRPLGACPTSGFGGVKPWVAVVGHHVQNLFGIKTIYGVSGGSVPGSDHPLGLALDFMVYRDRALGDRVAAYVLAHQLQFGITYVIWYQRINFGAGWVPMADRGGVTANHMDHVHVSFLPVPPPGINTLTC